MVSASRKISQRVGRDFAQDAHGQAGAGERLAQDDFLGQAQFQPELPHFVLEQAFQRLDQFEFHFLGQAADVVMALDQRGRIAGDGHGLDHVGIQRALRQKFRRARALGRRLKNFDERLADDFAFAFGIGHAFEPAQKQFRGVLVLQFDFEMPPENLPHHLRLAPAQQTIVDKNAGQLVADGLVQQRRRHARIHPAAQAQNDPFAAHLRADFLDGLVDVMAHRPVLAAAADAVDEIGNDFPAARRVDDFGMKLQAEKFPRAVLDGGEFGIVRVATALKPRGNLVSLSPCEFQTCKRLRADWRTARRRRSVTGSVPLPYSRFWPLSTLPPRNCAINCTP